LTTPLRLETSRLRIRWLQPGDAEFIFRLVNDSAWLLDKLGFYFEHKIHMQPTQDAIDLCVIHRDS
jgi:hypothetical protein